MVQGSRFLPTDFHRFSRIISFPSSRFFYHTDSTDLHRFGGSAAVQGSRFKVLPTDFHRFPRIIFFLQQIFCHTDSRDLHRFGGFAAGSRLKVQKETNYHEFPTNFLVHTDSTELTDILIRNKLSLISHKFFLMHNKSGSQAALNSPPF